MTTDSENKIAIAELVDALTVAHRHVWRNVQGWSLFGAEARKDLETVERVLTKHKALDKGV